MTKLNVTLQQRMVRKQTHGKNSTNLKKYNDDSKYFNEKKNKKFNMIVSSSELSKNVLTKA